jgi:hypothetical protein
MAGLLVGFQMALCVILLAASGLTIHSTVKLYSAPLAIDPSNVLTMRVDLPQAKYTNTPSVSAFYRKLKTTVAGLPGVTEVSLASRLPMGGWQELRGEVEAGRGKPGVVGPIDGLVVDADYFRTLAVPLRRGQTFA